MQLTLCFLLASVICIAIGYCLSPRKRVTGPREYCTECGWTREKVQPCQFEQYGSLVVVPMCFDCSVKHDALPYKELTASSQNTACA